MAHGIGGSRATGCAAVRAPPVRRARHARAAGRRRERELRRRHEDARAPRRRRRVARRGRGVRLRHGPPDVPLQRLHRRDRRAVGGRRGCGGLGPRARHALRGVDRRGGGAGGIGRGRPCRSRTAPRALPGHGRAPAPDSAAAAGRRHRPARAGGRPVRLLRGAGGGRRATGARPPPGVPGPSPARLQKADAKSRQTRYYVHQQSPRREREPWRRTACATN